MRPDITICLMTCGEVTEQDCIRALRDQGRDDYVFDEVRNVHPATTALNTMITNCDTEFLVPLDADMVLYKGAMDRIRRALATNPSRDWHSILFPLWDTLTQEKIMALKVFRTSIVKSIPYKDDPCPDIQHYQDLTAAGYKAVNLMGEEPIGDHVVRGNFFCYAKYRDLYMVTRSHPESILESHFKGGTDIKSRASRHFDFFRERYTVTKNPDYLYCIAGMVEGLTEPLTHKSKDLGNAVMKVPAEEAESRFRRWLGKWRVWV